MKKNYLFIVSTLLLIFAFSSFSAYAVVSVKGYYRTDGTYVAPHYRSDPDGNVYNNWSTKGNVNPYTGKEGTKNVPGASESWGAQYRKDANGNSPANPPSPTSGNIQREIKNVKWKYRENHEGFRERLIDQIVDYLNADKNQVATEVYSALPDVK